MQPRGVAAGIGRQIDQRHSTELRAAGILRGGKEIRFVVNRTHDVGPLSGKSAWCRRACWTMPDLTTM
jgi:hypothetical protein